MKITGMTGKILAILFLSNSFHVIISEDITLQ